MPPKLVTSICLARHDALGRAARVPKVRSTNPQDLRQRIAVVRTSNIDPDEIAKALLSVVLRVLALLAGWYTRSASRRRARNSARGMTWSMVIGRSRLQRAHTPTLCCSWRRPSSVSRHAADWIDCDQTVSSYEWHEICDLGDVCIFPRRYARFLGAGDETRTRDSLLGRQVLYQLSYPRVGLN